MVSVAKVEHCYYCFQVIEAELKGEPEPEATHFDGAQEYALFVTWNIWPTAQQHGTPRLRGCIGTFEAQPLGEGLAEYASIAAFKDRRFSPISSAELPRLQCGVSLLTGFEECDDYLDWEIGTHGIYIHLPNPAVAPLPLLQGGQGDTSSSSSGSSTPAKPARTSRNSFLTATYLPDVMPAQNWTKQEAIDSAIRKAGFHGKITNDIRRALRVQRYRSDKIDQSYTEYQAWKAQQQSS